MERARVIERLRAQQRIADQRMHQAEKSGDRYQRKHWSKRRQELAQQIIHEQA